MARPAASAIALGFFEPSAGGVPGTGSGSLGAVTVSGLTGSAAGKAAGGGTLGSVTVSGIAGAAAGKGAVSGALGTSPASSPAGSATGEGFGAGQLGAASASGIGGSATGQSVVVGSGALGVAAASSFMGAATGGAAVSGAIGNANAAAPSATGYGKACAECPITESVSGIAIADRFGGFAFSNEELLPMADVTYSLATNFPNARVRVPVLLDQVRQSAVGQPVDRIVVNGDSVILSFKNAVAGAALTALNAVIAAHAGDDYGAPVQSAVANPQQSNNTTNDEVALALALQPMQAGDYIVSWICEFAPTTNVANTGARVAFQSNVSGSFVDHYEDNLGAPSSAGTFWRTFTGSLVTTIAAGASPTIRLIWRRLGASSNAALIRKCRIAIAPVQN